MEAYHSGEKTHEGLLAQELSGKAIYMGLDLHRMSWPLTVRSRDREISKMTLPSQWEALRKVIDRFGAARTSIVYEAGYFADSACTTPSPRVAAIAW